MINLNRVQIIGNLTRDPELKYTQNNIAYAKAGIAVNRSWKDKNGEWQEQTTFVDVTVWGKLAERLAQMKKGEKLFLEGRLQTDSWQTDKGEKRSRLVVIGEDFAPWGIKKHTDEVPPDSIPDELPPDDEASKLADEVDEGLKKQKEEGEPKSEDDIPF